MLPNFFMEKLTFYGKTKFRTAKTKPKISTVILNQAVAEALKGRVGKREAQAEGLHFGA